MNAHARIASANRYAPENLVFWDFESRCKVPIKLGSYRYAIEADAILLSYAIGLGPVKRIDKRGRPITWADYPDDLKQAIADGRIFCAFNAGFDRCVHNHAVPDAPFLDGYSHIDARATALAHNLPDDLESLSRRLGGPGKQRDGKQLIALFCGENAIMPDEAPEKWNRFCTYADQDVEELRRTFRLMLPALTVYEWNVYHANEVINDTGAGVDLRFCEHAARLASEEATRIGERLAVITDGKITSINQNIRLAQWVHDRMPYAEGREMMCTIFKEESESEDDDDLVEVVKMSIARGIVERLLDMLKVKGCNDAALLEVLELREFGASAAPKKFQAILDRQINGRVHGEFMFSGAGQTGRFSGKGVQLQNLTRSVLGKDDGDDYGHWEEPTVAMIADGCSLEELLAHGRGEVAARKLALTVRPAFCASGTRTLVKADYRAVEARVCPWLAKSEGGERRLDAFRAVDADSSLPDIYTVTAAGMTGKRPQDISKAERQRGKVGDLACQFGGGKNALHSMAANYRLYFEDAEAQQIVTAWRAANPWAPEFWGRHTKDASYGLFGAARRAIMSPQIPVACGRVQFVYVPLRRDGMLICILPSGRPLIYPSCRMRDYDVIDKKTKRVIETRHGLTFRRARGVIALYGGRFAENVTQAAAADLLREAIVILISQGWKIVSHSHDEIVIECERRDVLQAKMALRAAMIHDRGWADGLPLEVDITERWYYSAAKQLEEAA